MSEKIRCEIQRWENEGGQLDPSEVAMTARCPTGAEDFDKASPAFGEKPPTLGMKR